MNRVKLEALLLDQVASLRRSDGDAILLDKLPGILRDVLSSMANPNEPELEVLRVQVNEMQSFIKNARKEISSIRPNALRDIEIPEATDELDAVVMATEEATHAILDSVEKLEHICVGFTGNQAEELQGLVVRIYEASNFQDVTGQRISKVVNTLQGIETRVTKLIALFPGVDEGGAAGSEGDAKFLNGPQLPQNACAQDDIDALFDKI